MSLGTCYCASVELGLILIQLVAVLMSVNLVSRPHPVHTVLTCHIPVINAYSLLSTSLRVTTAVL